MHIEVSIELYNKVTETAIATLTFNSESLEEAINTKAMIQDQLPKDWALR